MENRELFKVAEQALEKAYAPYSNFKVSAALLTDRGKCGKCVLWMYHLCRTHSMCESCFRRCRRIQVNCDSFQ